MSRSSFNRLDIIIVFFIIGFSLAYYAFFFDSQTLPYEDAAILMRYSKHVAEGDGIVWNIGQAPVDGATDFLYMLLLAAVLKAGLPQETAVQLIVMLSHLLTVIIVYAGVLRINATEYLP
jgi:arabinofuranosyltransferase